MTTNGGKVLERIRAKGEEVYFVSTTLVNLTRRRGRGPKGLHHYSFLAEQRKIKNVSYLL